MSTVKRSRSTGTAGLYVAPPPIHQWLCGDTVRELRGTAPRVLDTRPTPSGWEATWSDFLAGGGGSTSGIFQVPGAGVSLAVNHWALAVQTHNANFPDTEHDCANVQRPDPRRYRGSDFAWFSPECTKWSMAAGRKCDYDLAADQMELPFDVPDGSDPEAPAAKEARWRSRMQMLDVVRFAEVHRYRGLIVENVPDILKWSNFGRWLADMSRLGYRHKVITLNSAFAGAMGTAAPQLRDRVYIVFWQAKYSTPNWRKWLSPKAWCPSCGDVVDALYTAKPGPRRPMRYNAQYYYRCPKVPCAGQKVHPYVLPAAAAIDWSLPTTRIGDRKTPLAEATRARVAAGIEKYWSPFLAETAGHTFERRPGVRTRGLDGPLGTQSTTATTSLAVPAMMVPTGGTWRGKGDTGAATVDGPMSTRTTRENDAIVGLTVPLESRDGQRARPIGEPLRTQTGRHDLALVVPLRNHGVPQLAYDAPLVTVAAAGTHHALVMRNRTARGNPGQMCTPAGEPIRTLTTEGRPSLIMRNNEGGAEMCTPTGEPVRTLTTKGHQSLIGHDQVLYGYDSGDLRPLGVPMPTQTTVQGDALLGATLDVDDCTLRMLAVAEIQAGMGFAAGYRLLGTAQRDKVRMLGNAVTPPAAADLAACLMEAVTGIEYALAC